MLQDPLARPRPETGLALAIALTALAAVARGDGELLIRGVTLVSPERETPLPKADVLVRDGRIAAVGTDLEGGEGTLVVDGSGRWLVPGLIDSHVHVGHPILLDDATIEARPELLTAYRAQLPRSFLHAGFTTLIDLDLRPDVERAFLATPEHPRLYHAGRGIRIAGGYGPSLVPAAVALQVFPNLVFEPEQADSWPTGLDPERYTPALAVERAAAAGARCVKTYVEPGFGGLFDWPIPSLATLRALRSEAGARGLPFVVHATGVEGWSLALQADADVLAHGLWHFPGDWRDTEPCPQAQALLAEAARRGVAVQPTLRVILGEHETFTGERLEDPRLAHVLPPELLAWAHTEEGRATQRAQLALFERLAVDAPAERLASMDRRVVRMFQELLARNARLILGSDTPASEGMGNPPGLNGLLELEQWAAAGMPLARLLDSATLANARAFGLDSELGSIEPGKRADLLLLTADPLADVHAYDAIEAVLLDGRLLPRASLSARR